MADIVFMLVFRHCLPRYFVCIFNSLSAYSWSIAWRTCKVEQLLQIPPNDIASENGHSSTDRCPAVDRPTLSERLRMGALLKTTSIITRECLFFVSLFRIRSKLMQAKTFRQQYGWPGTCNRERW